MAGEPLRVKHVFELDNRQLMAIFAGIFLMLVLFFGLGINVGWRLSVEMGGEPMADAMGDMPPEEIAEPSENTLDSPTPNIPPPPQRQPEATAQKPSQPASNAPSLLARLQQAEQAEQKARNGGDTKTPVVVPDVPSKASEKSAPPKEDSLPPSFKTVKQPEPPAAKKTAPPEKKPASPPPPTKVEKPTPTKEYTVQFHSFRTRERAQRVIDKFKPFDDRKPFIMELPVNETLTWYKVCIGRFQDYQQAKAYEKIYTENTKDKQTMVTRVLK